MNWEHVLTWFAVAVLAAFGLALKALIDGRSLRLRVEELVKLLDRPAGLVRQGLSARSLATVTGIRAADEIEGMLATQMVATHTAAITALRRLKGSETIPQQDSNGNLAVKLLRIFAAQVGDARRGAPLSSYGGAGKQRPPALRDPLSWPGEPRAIAR
jgi:hypothetical protein